MTRKLASYIENQLNKFTILNTDKVALVLSLFYLIGWLIFTFFFRYSYSDEALYFQETSLISELIKKGIWFGNYGVGLHGFLLKLPVALVFTITGPSVFIATSFNLLLASFSFYLFYKILKDNLNVPNWWSLFGSILLITSTQFVLTTPTYLRETPVLFSLLLFIKILAAKKSRWLLGLSLLFILDAKEYVFFLVAPSMVIWLIVEMLRERGESILQILKNFLSQTFPIFIPPIVWILLMAYTSLIPANMYSFYLMGLTSRNNEPVINLKYSQETEQIFAKFAEARNSDSQKAVLRIVKPLVTIPSHYINKLFHFRTFGFLSIPFAILVPATIVSYFYFKRNIKREPSIKTFLPVLLWVYLILYMSKNSHGRYLLPLFPTIIYYYINFLREKYNLGQLLKIFAATTLFSAVAMTQENGYIPQKLVLNFLLIGSTFGYKLYTTNNMQYRYMPALLTLLSISLCTTSVAYAYLISDQMEGQIATTLKYGKYANCDTIGKVAAKYSPAVINSPRCDGIINVYAQNFYLDPLFGFRLNSKIAKNQLVTSLGRPLLINSTDFSKQKVLSAKVSNIIYISKGDSKDTQNIKTIGTYSKLIETVDITNQKIYVFRIN